MRLKVVFVKPLASCILALDLKQVFDTLVRNISFNQRIHMSNEPDLTDPRQRLLLAAEEVFAEKGFTAATIRDITDRAGANVAAINYYFGDKERLYIDTVRFAHSCAANGLPFTIPPTAPPVEKMRAFIHEIARRMTEPTRTSALRLMMREMAQPTAAAREIVRDFIQPMAFGLRSIIREILPGASEARVLMVGFSVMGQVLFYRQNRQVAELIFGKESVDELTTEMIADHVTGFTLAALGQVDSIRGVTS